MAHTLEADEGSVLLALQALIAEYWARVDRQKGATDAPCESFFTDDAVMVLGTLRVAGSAGLAEFFANREANEIARQRTSRHVTSNHRLRLDGPARAIVHANVVVHAGFGAWPLPSEAPAGIADFVFHCVRDERGRWRFSGMYADSVFVGAAAPAFAKASPAPQA
jgi:hypothetical protein